VECFNVEPLARFDAARSEEDESFDTSESVEPLAVPPARWDVRYGPRELEVRRNGDIGRLLD